MTDTTPGPSRSPSPAWPVVARLALIRCFPLKSGAGLTPRRARLDAAGVVGDRAWAVVDAGGTVLRPRHHPDLARLSLAPPRRGAGGALADAAGPPRVLLDGERLDAPALAELLGVPGARLAAVRQDGGRTAAATSAARAALHLVGEAAALDPHAPAGADPGRRANLVLTGLAPGAERAWVGARLRVAGPAAPGAGVLLEVTATPRHCLGVYAAVLAGGQVAVGDPVLVGPVAGGGAGVDQ